MTFYLICKKIFSNILLFIFLCKKAPPYHPPTPKDHKLNKQINTTWGSCHTCSSFFIKMSLHIPFIKFQLSFIGAQPYPLKILFLTNLSSYNLKIVFWQMICDNSFVVSIYPYLKIVSLTVAIYMQTHRRTLDKKWLETLIWAFISGKLKYIILKSKLVFL